MMHEKFINQENILTFCGFKKFHPHDDYSIIRLAYNNKITIGEIKEQIVIACNSINDIFDKVNSLFE